MRRARSERFVVRRFSVLTCLSISLATLAACAGPLPRLATEQDIRAATGLESLVEFRTESMPLDAPDEPGAQTASLSLRAAAERSVRNSAAVQVALARTQAALAEAEQARLFPNPSLSVVGRWGNGPFAFEASLSAPFVQMLQTRRRASAADRRLERAASEAIAAAADALALAQSSYADAQAADARVRLVEERLLALEQLVAVADSRLRNGEGSAIERAQTEAKRFDASQEAVVARRAAHEARVRLAQSLGQPSAVANWALDPLVAPAASTAREQDWIAIALQRRHELHAFAFELAALGDEAALAVFWPWQGSLVGAETQRTPVWFTGPNATVPLPIFDLGEAESRRVGAEVIGARHRITAAARDVVAEVRVAHARAASAAAELARLQRDGIPQKQRAFDAAASMQRNGELGRDAVLLAQQELIAAREAEAELVHAALLADVQLRRAVGGAAAAASVKSPHSESDSNKARNEGEAQ